MKRAGLVLSLFFLCAGAAEAQELVLDTYTTYKAKVVEVVEQGSRTVPGTDTIADYQTIRAEIQDKDKKGETVTIENDYYLLEKGDRFYLTHIENQLDDREFYSVGEPYRLPPVLFFVGLFLLVTLLFGGKQGMRGLVALALSFFFIIYLLFPGIIAGYSPALVSIGVSALIIILGSYITHGWSKTTSAAVIGMVVTIIITGVLAWIGIEAAHLSGFASDEAVYLNFETRGGIDFAGLLLGSILIGLLGVLYDAAIGQAVAVEELRNVGPHLPRYTIYKRALRIGREHIGALVDSLAIAYVGASLPLLLLYSHSAAPLAETVNREIFATEIIRIMIGSIGLILAVPITTLVAVWMLMRTEESDAATREKEARAIGAVTHTHEH